MGSLRIGGVIVAAGLSRRMGDFKPLLTLGEKTIIETTVNSLIEAGINEIVVVVGHRGEEVESLVKNKCTKVVWNYDYERSDMFKSIKLGLEALNDISGVFIVPGDMPLILKDTFRTLVHVMEETNGKVIIPTIDSRPKHPPLIHINCIEEILNYKGNDGLRGALSKFKDLTCYVPVDDIGCGMDVDTTEDYKKIKSYYEKNKIKREKEVENELYKRIHS